LAQAVSGSRFLVAVRRSIAFSIALDDRRVMDDAVERGNSHGGIGDSLNG